MQNLPDDCIIPFDLSIQLGLLSFNCDLEDALVRKTAIQGNTIDHTRDHHPDTAIPDLGRMTTRSMKK